MVVDRGVWTIIQLLQQHRVLASDMSRILCDTQKIGYPDILHRQSINRYAHY